MRKIINNLKMRNLKKKGYDSFTITIDGKVQYIYFYKEVQEELKMEGKDLEIELIRAYNEAKRRLQPQ